ncbi:hypothetical protein SAMN06295937_100757 [Sphingopyxis flava]|uniref:Uncharacterized protein n=2 Tax=Sphingopyxis flava TaxID=1507287 RepID=A0A1T5BQE7_9SPHN|nr:hypothetical protein SAMN06295937_100757 [Sphingopyxis flava]
MLYLALAGASFVFVFLKAFQQRNVAFDNYIAVMPISIMMASVEVFTITKVAAAGWQIGVVLSVGTASALGAISAMHLHKWLFADGGPRRFFNKEKTE